MTARFGVCMITTHFYPYRGGAEMQAERLSTWLAAHDIPVMVITRHIKGTPMHEVYNGFEIFRVPQSKIQPLRVLNWFLFGGWYLLKNRHKWDVIHTHDPSLPSTLGYLINRFLPKKTMVINLHRGGELGDLQMLLNRGKWGRMNFERYKNDPRTHFIAIDQPILDEMVREKVESSKVFFRVNGVDPNTFHPVDQVKRTQLRQQLGLPVDAQIVTVVCRQVETKGLPNLLDAWKQVPQNAHLVMVGTGEIHEQLKAKAQAELPGRVTLPGKVESVLPYLQASDVWTLPSLTEALPVSMLEAMSTGLPIVATTVGGIPDVIEEGVSGYLVPPGQVQPLADALNKILSDPTKRKAMGEAARQTVLNRYAIDTVAATYVDLYRQIISKANPGKPLQPKLETAK
jgi:glycosyltransferase involved in cell wall biosynthesis